ncbi:MAG: hypothetical protein KGN02_09195 [bacterium]|nr:hypothetical protein [bacterium]
MKLPRIHIELGDVIVEMLSIVVAILLALAVNNWQERVHREHQLRENVANIVRELEVNENAIARVEPQHRREAAAIAREVARLHTRGERMNYDEFAAFFARIAPRGLGGLTVQDVAWSVAQADRSLASMPSNDRLELAETYAEQHDLQVFYERLIANIESYSAPNRFALLANAQPQFGDVLAAESDLLNVYQKLIPQLRARYRLGQDDFSRPGQGGPAG